jgi:hypothetical protein
LSNYYILKDLPVGRLLLRRALVKISDAATPVLILDVKGTRVG